jgi:hypothetical protein
MSTLGFFTLGLKKSICWEGGASLSNPSQQVLIGGDLYDLTPIKDLLQEFLVGEEIREGQDLSRLFSSSSPADCPVTLKECIIIPISSSSNNSSIKCLSPTLLRDIQPTGRFFSTWDRLDPSSIVYDSRILDLASFSRDYTLPPLANPSSPSSKDWTRFLASNSTNLSLAKCISSRYTIAFIDSQSFGCSVYSILMILALSSVLGVILVRFIMALGLIYTL